MATLEEMHYNLFCSLCLWPGRAQASRVTTRLPALGEFTLPPCLFKQEATATAPPTSEQRTDGVGDRQALQPPRRRLHLCYVEPLALAHASKSTLVG